MMTWWPHLTEVPVSDDSHMTWHIWHRSSYMMTWWPHLTEVPVSDDCHGVQHDVGQGPERGQEREHLPHQVQHHGVRSSPALRCGIYSNIILEQRVLFVSWLTLVLSCLRTKTLTSAGLWWLWLRSLHDGSRPSLQWGKSWQYSYIKIAVQLSFAKNVIFKAFLGPTQ